MMNNRFIVRNKIYFDIGDYINEVKFKIQVPIYALQIPNAVEDKSFIPTYISEIDKNQLVFSMATISDMINYTNQSITFSIIPASKTLFVYEVMVDYIEALNKTQSTSEFVMKFLKKANKFQILIERALDRLSNVDPNIKQKYRDKKSIMDVIDGYK